MKTGTEKRALRKKFVVSFLSLLLAAILPFSTFTACDISDVSQGVQGEKGDKGEPGQDGKDGVDGKDGAQGEKGEKGDKGDPGQDGKDGVQGEKGEKGEKGDPGKDGMDGADGKDGSDGRGILKTEIIDGWLYITYTNDPEHPVKVGRVTEEKEPTGTEGLEFYPLPDGTYGVSSGKAKYLSEIIIPATYHGKAVTAILDDGFKNSANLTKISIPESVIRIGNCAFEDCSSLISVTLPVNLISIERYAFWGCCNLTNFTIPKNVTSIGEGAFGNCSSLTSISIPNGVIYIESRIFAGCSSLTSIAVPEGVTEIKWSAFASCSNLDELTLPVSLKYLGRSVVTNCNKLSSITYRGTQAQWGEVWSNSESRWKDGWNGKIICADTPTEQPNDPREPNVPSGLDRNVMIIVPKENNKYFSFDTNSGTEISKAIYHRNEQVEKRLGISLKMIDVHSSDFFQQIRVSQLGGEFAYDLAVLPSESSSFAIEGFFYNLLDKDNRNYTNLSHSWYNQRYVEAAPINGVLPFVTGDMTPETWDHISVMYYNKDLSDAYDYPLTEIVREARWTIEIMREMTREVHNDINENGVFDEGDLGGLAIARASDCRALLYATGFQIAGRDENNAVTLSFSQRNSDTASHLYQIYTDKTNTFWNASDSSIARNVFIGGQAMLLCDTLGQASKIKDAKFNYGILPLPKYNAAQVDYISVPSSVSLIGVLCNNDISASTATLEVMGFYSQLEILPAYKTSFGLTDQENLQMLGIVLESITPNFETVWYSVGISEGILAQIQSGSAFTDFWKNNSAVYNKKLSDLASELENMQ